MDLAGSFKIGMILHKFINGEMSSRDKFLKERVTSISQEVVETGLVMTSVSTVSFYKTKSPTAAETSSLAARRRGEEMVPLDGMLLRALKVCKEVLTDSACFLKESSTEREDMMEEIYLS